MGKRLLKVSPATAARGRAASRAAARGGIGVIARAWSGKYGIVRPVMWPEAQFRAVRVMGVGRLGEARPVDVDSDAEGVLPRLSPAWL